MKKETTGWVVINVGHPRTGNKFVVSETFSNKRTDAVSKFIQGSGCNWRYWKTQYNFRVVRASNIISVDGCEPFACLDYLDGQQRCSTQCENCKH